MSTRQQTVITRGLRVDEGILVGIKGPNSGREYLLVGHQIVLGRGDSCDITLRDPNVSRKHAVLCNDHGHYSIKDNRSKNGTYINGKSSNQKNLRNGDIIAIGDSLFRFKFNNSSKPKSRSVRLSTADSGLSGRSRSKKAKDFHLDLLSNKGWNLGLAALFANKKKGRPQEQSFRRKGGHRKTLIYLALIVILILTALPLLSKEKQVRFDPNRTSEPTVNKTITKPSTVRVLHRSEQRKVINQSSSSVIPTEIKSDNKVATLPIANLSAARQKYNQAMQAMTAGDFRLSIKYFDEVLQAQPNHPIAANKLQEAEKKLNNLIQEYYNVGLREYTNLYYDRALQQWQKVLALSSNFNDEYFQKATDKIEEVNNKILETR